MSEKSLTYVIHGNDEGNKDISYFKKVVHNTIRLVIDRNFIATDRDGNKEIINFDYENGRYLKFSKEGYKVSNIRVNGDVMLNPLLTDEEFIEYAKKKDDYDGVKRRYFSTIFPAVGSSSHELAVFHLEKIESKGTSSVPTENLTRITKFLKDNPVSVIVIITPIPLVRATKEAYNNIALNQGSFSRCQIFTEDELIYNSPSHFTVPVAHRMTDEEKEEFLKETGCILINIQGMYVSDAISKYFGFDVGDIIKLYDKSTVNSNIADYFLDYRRIINNA